MLLSNKPFWSNFQNDLKLLRTQLSQLYEISDRVIVNPIHRHSSSITQKNENRMWRNVKNMSKAWNIQETFNETQEC